MTALNLGGWRFDELHPQAYRMLVEGAPAILYIDRPDEPSTNLYTSPQVVDVLGFTVDEWMSDPALWQRQVHVDDRDRILEAHRVSNERGERFLEEYRFITRDRREVWLRDEAVPVRDATGKVLLWRGVMLDITERKQAEDKLRRSLEVLRRTLQQRRQLAQRLETAQEEERRRIAADIHDDPIQVMSAVDMRLQMLSQSSEAARPDQITGLQLEVRAAIERLRNLLFELRPTALDREGLAAALRLYLEHTARQTGWAVDVRSTLDGEPVPEQRALLYRIAQEAITNARKHAEASRVDVDLGPAGEGVMLRIVDDGRGFSPGDTEQPRPGHLGLSTMVERAELSGGWARITSAHGRGTTVECWVPVDVRAGSRPLLRP
jgi:PAS domain S-box-containing protein